MLCDCHLQREQNQIMDNEAKEILHNIMRNSEVQKMKQYIQHGKVSTYEHCKNVAKLSLHIDRRLSLHSDLKVLLTGAMLHDFYLYDWHESDGGSHRLHGFTHPRTACRNARRVFDIDEGTARVITTHMWPLNLTPLPRSREEWIVCIADKSVSLYETLFRR